MDGAIDQACQDLGQTAASGGDHADFNVIPADEYIYDPKSWRKNALIQSESRATYQRLLEQGWTDSLRHIYGEDRIYTLWDYFRQHAERDRGFLIDHLILNRVLAKRFKDAGVDRRVRLQEKASDRARTWIQVEAG